MEHKKIIKNFISKNKKIYDNILKEIKSNNRILILRHIRPDFDAYGAQLGLAFFIKENFKNKDVKFIGDERLDYVNRIYPECDKPSRTWFDEPYLLIIVDTNTYSRISGINDERLAKANNIILIDHHPLENTFCNKDLTIVDTSVPAASEIISNMLFYYCKKGYKFPLKSAEFLYTGIIGDTGRFLFPSTTIHTHAISEELINLGINTDKLYKLMYEETVSDINMTKFIYNSFKITKSGRILYYIVKDEDLKKYNMTVTNGKDNVKRFSNIQNIEIYFSVTEDISKPCYRVSLRSKSIDISKIANKYHGGGHKNASGAELNNLEELPNLIKDLEELIDSSK